MLSKKYYEAFAKILAENNANENVVRELEDFFKNDNNKFDRLKFRSKINKLRQVI